MKTLLTLLVLLATFALSACSSGSGRYFPLTPTAALGNYCGGDQ